METPSHYCLKDPQGRVIGFRLDADDLGDDIYDVLDWADEHFESHEVEQTDGCVYVYAESARENLDKEDITVEPVTIDTDEPDDTPGGGPMGGGFGGGGGTVESGPSGDDGGGATAHTPGMP